MIVIVIVIVIVILILIVVATRGLRFRVYSRLEFRPLPSFL